jgi:hypothetical protein
VGDNTGLSDILDTQDVETDFLLAYLRFTGFDFFARSFSNSAQAVSFVEARRLKSL